MIFNDVHVNGAITSPDDYRTLIIAGEVATAAAVNPTPDLPISLYTDFYQKFDYILMQGKRPSCVSHSVVYLMTLWWYLKTGQIVYFSPRFLHILSAFPGARPEDGRSPSTVLGIAKNVGCCTVDLLPNNVALDSVTYNDPNLITQAMRDEAAKYKIPGYIPVAVTQEAIRKAIQTYGAVTILFEIGDSLWMPSWAQKDIDPLRPPAIVLGRHEMTGIGWNADMDRVINEWSKLWANNGEIDYLFNEMQQHMFEAWAIAEVPSSALATVQGLPAPHEFVHVFNTNLSRGNTGDEVRALQIALSIAGFNTYPEINGIYGPLTSQAVLAFQISKKVAPLITLQSLNGASVGPATRAALNVLYST